MGYLPIKLEKQILKKRIPVDVSFELTHKCNLACGICYIHHDAGAKELSTNEIKAILDRLAKEGSLFLTFTGGEPFLRDDLLEILDHAANNNFAVTLKTNGTLINESIAKRLKEFRLQEVHISLLGATAETHEKITGIKGSFEKAVHAIKLLKKEKIRVATMSVITRGYVGEVNRLQLLAEELKTDDSTFTAYIFPKNNGDKAPLRYRLSDNELREFFRILKHDEFNDDECMLQQLTEKEKEDDLFYSCTVGRNGFSINPYGKVMPCISLPMEIGDLKKQTVQEIIHSSKNNETIELIRLKNNRDCYHCEDRIGCLRCPGMAYLENGSAASAPGEGCRQTQICNEVADE